MKKIAVFSDCMPTGVCSMYVLNDNNIKSIVGLKKLNIKTEKRYSIINSLKEKYDVTVFFYPSRTEHDSNELRGKNFKVNKPLVYEILNTDLTEFDIILIFGCTHSYFYNINELGNSTDLTPKTILGAYNLIFKELREKYDNKKIIFIQTPYRKYNKKMKFSEYVSIIHEHVTNNGFDSINFYNDILKNKKHPFKYFPDGAHPSIDVEIILTDYIVKKIEDYANN